MFLKNNVFTASLLALIIGSSISCNTTEHSIRIGSTLDESHTVQADDIKRAIDNGIGFLLATQNSDGSWGSLGDDFGWLDGILSHDAFRQATTALCCMAMMETKGLDSERNAALNRGLRYLMSQQPYRRATSVVLYNVWSSTYVTQCLARAMLCKGIEIPKDELTAYARKWLKQLQDGQAADGGWCYYDLKYGLRQPSGWWSTSFNTGAILEALWDAEKAGLDVDRRTKAAAIRCLENLRTPDKNFTYAMGLFFRFYRNTTKGAIGRAQPCNLALFRNGKIPTDDLKLGLERMFAEHQFMEMGQYRPIPHESWYQTSGYYFLFDHFYAAEVISRLPQAQQNHYWKALARALMNCKQEDGSWWDYRMYGYTKPYGTAFALLALSPTLDALSR